MASDWWKCPRCGSDWLRGLDPGDTFDGETGECGRCGLDVAVCAFVDDSWAIVDASGEGDARVPHAD